MQTRMLALNANIEAARAGQHGAGFGAIAKEVRSLSDRVTEAVDQVDELNGTVHAELDSAAQIVGKMHSAVESIEVSSSEVGKLAGQVAATTAAQGEAIGSVVHAMSELDSATRYNTTSAIQVAGAAETLLAHAQRLREATDAWSEDGLIHRKATAVAR